MRRILLLLALTALPLLARPWIAIFGSYDCMECAAVKQEWAREHAAPEDPVLLFLPIEHPRNYALLTRLEEQLEVREKGTSFPVFLVGNRMLPTVAEFRALLPQIRTLATEPCTAPVAHYLAEAAETATESIVTLLVQKQSPTPKPAETTPAPPKPQLAFFEQPACAKCSRQQKELELLLEQMPSLQLERFDVTTLDGRAMLARFHQAHPEVPRDHRNLAPMVCWADGFITGRLAEATELRDALLHAKGEPFWSAPLTEAERQAERQAAHALVDTILLTQVITGGLLDGINPCAFATSIFLISYLLFLKKRPREIALVGFGFCTGVFLAYFLYGLGISFLLDFLTRFSHFRQVLYGVFALISLTLAIGSLVDAFRYRRSGRTSDMTFGLSGDTHRSINDKIRTLADKGTLLLLPASVALGAVVSSMELACTGQIYAPVLAAINADGFTWRAVLLTLLYNLLFIVPLVVITILACRGVGAQSLAAWAKRHVFPTKLVMAILLFVIAATMAWFALRA